jgi:uncharacterized membrane protein
MARAHSFIAKYGLFFAAIVSFAPPALADLSLCNRTSFVAEASLAIEIQGTAATRGWFRVDPGQCRIVLRGKIEAEHIYVHAHPLPVYGAVKALTPPQIDLCVGEKDFLVAGAMRCTKSSERMVPFSEVRPRDVDDIATVTLAEPNDYGVDQARLAAIQRLLTLAGYSIEPIDGLTGPKTDNALTQFQRERGLLVDSVSSPILLDLLMDAVRDGTGRGLLWCNETTHAVMAALGIEDANTVVTRGWWRIEPGACARPDLPRRPIRQIYTFAEAIDSNEEVIEKNGRPLQWGGGTKLCTRNTKFETREHSRCESRGLTTQGFDSIDLSAKTGTTVRFREP